MLNVFTQGMSTELHYTALQYTGEINPAYTGPALSLPIAALGNEVTYEVEGSVRSQNTSKDWGDKKGCQRALIFLETNPLGM